MVRKSAESKVTGKGQITLPKVVRDHLRLQAGQRVGFEIDDQSLVRLHARNLDLRSLRGILKTPGRKRLTVAAMNTAIARGYAGE